MGKIYILTFVFLGLAMQSSNTQTGSGNLTLTVTGLKNNSGKVIASIFKNPDGFPREKGKSVQQVKAIINKNSSELVFKNLP